ncbi:hypothetical protein BK140_16955 [Paenibacillus macerans]|nr:hypothetical protein BK140_16955 [Paenibacillus macerans]
MHERISNWDYQKMFQIARYWMYINVSSLSILFLIAAISGYKNVVITISESNLTNQEIINSFPVLANMMITTAVILFIIFLTLGLFTNLVNRTEPMLSLLVKLVTRSIIFGTISSALLPILVIINFSMITIINEFLYMILLVSTVLNIILYRVLKGELKTKN